MQYDGQISSDGKFHGHGKIVYENGESYDGEWHAGQRHGTGTYRYSDGGVYVGNWEQDRINGRGVSQYADGNRCEGAFARAPPRPKTRNAREIRAAR